MDIPILFEDDSVLVIDKPPGLVVTRADSVKAATVQDWVENRPQDTEIKIKRKAESNDFYERSGIVHRIDKETSGILVIAKTNAAFSNLQQQFKARDVKKTYLAIVHGVVVPSAGEIHAPVGRLPWNRLRFGIVPEGREALTGYIVEKCFQAPQSGEKLSLLAITPATGRTHQIRVHMAYIHHPIVGDTLYAGRKVSRQDRTWVPRVMLHAWKLSFLHPDTHARVAIEAPIPDDMKRVAAYAGK